MRPVAQVLVDSLSSEVNRGWLVIDGCQLLTAVAIEHPRLPCEREGFDIMLKTLDRLWVGG